MPEDSAHGSGEHLYGAQEAAEFLGIHRSTLHLAVAHNVLVPDAHTPGGHVRFRRETLDEFTARLHCEPATSRSQLMCELVETLDDPEGDIAFCHRAFARIRQAIPAFTMCAVALSTPTPDDPHAIQPLVQEGFPEHLAPQYMAMRPRMEFATTTALRTHEPELCEDISRKRALRMGTSSLLRRGELRCFAIIPIIVKDKHARRARRRERQAAPHSTAPSELPADRRGGSRRRAQLPPASARPALQHVDGRGSGHARPGVAYAPGRRGWGVRGVLRAGEMWGQPSPTCATCCGAARTPSTSW